MPITDLANDAKGYLNATNANLVRLFRKGKNNDWTYIDGSTAFSAADLSSGLELGIDARDIRRPGGWDGRTTVQFSVFTGGKEYHDSVALRVAPVLTHHHLQPVEYVLIRNSDNIDASGVYWGRMVQEINNITAAAGVKGGLKQAFKGEDRWSQDFVEPGYTAMPGPNGPVVLHVIIRSFQDDREAGRQAFTALRNSNTGAIQWLVEGGSQDSGGNIETIPPYEFNGKRWPAGRVISGKQVSHQPNAFAFFKAQEAQNALELDTSWLAVGHVDEFIQFLPAKTARGWAIMVADPQACLDMFNKLKKDGNGKLNWLSRKFNVAYPRDYPKTIDDLLALSGLKENTALASKKIEANLNILKKETGITDNEIFRLPALYHTSLGFFVDAQPAKAKAHAAFASGSVDGAGEVQDFDDEDQDVGVGLSILEAGRGLAAGSSKQQKQKRNDAAELIAVHPGVVNGVVLSSTQYMAPNPFGPIVNGVDILKQNAIDQYKKLNMEVKFVDDWNTLHSLDGEVHCGSNTVRTPTGNWW